MLLEREIERVILHGEYEPGDHMNEKELALRFGVSRGPVREALRSLEGSGLVEQIPNRGVFVRRLNAAHVAHIYDVRAALFAFAGRLVAVHASEIDVAQLRDLVDAMDRAIAAEDYETYALNNFALHEQIVSGAGNPILASQYLGLVKQLRLYRARNLMDREAVRASNDEHREMVKAIAARDPDGAYAAHHRHVATAKLRLMANPALNPTT
jgi:DNA-binding GntR family transcriptional regulator